MKIALLSTYCGHGGAAVANDRLAAALRSMGHDVTQISAGGTRHRVAFVAERADIFARNGFNRADLFKVSTARFGQRISQIPAVKEADVVVLGWVNQGFAQLDDLERIEAPMVWLMHDMWPLTGICHHAYECRRYEHQCGRCQFIHRRPRENDLSRQVRRAKEQLYGRRPIRFVAVSRWLAECAQRSSLLRGADVSVIPNIFDFEANPMKRTGETHIAMGAARLDDPIKGLPIAIEALNHLADHRPELARRAPLLLFGSVRNHRALDSLRYPHTMLGPVANSMEVLSRSAVVLSTSLYETFGLTLLEGLAAGCIPVTFGNSGQAEVVSHLRNGYVADSRSALSIAKGIEWALTQSSLTPEALRAEAARRFSPEAVGRQWDALLQNLCH
jgi:glycosyltransferase involved in cell wall biosynthesis